MDYVTKEDLKALSTDIKEHIDLLIKPIVEKQNGMETILIGKTKINGLVGGFKSIRIQMKAMYGLIVFIAIGLAKLLFF